MSMNLTIGSDRMSCPGCHRDTDLEYRTEIGSSAAARARVLVRARCSHCRRLWKGHLNHVTEEERVNA